VLVVGLILCATAVASAVILIVQNRGSVVAVHALGHTWTGHVYWLLLAGLLIVLVGVLGLALLRGARARQLRRQRAALATGKELPSERVRDPATSFFFADTSLGEADRAAGGDRTMRRHASRRGHHAA
jgi:uncharacterized integral membrane protein